MSDDPAESFGPYELHQVLGRGGMGVVYRARDRVKGRTVAVKLLARELAGDAAFRARFQRESRIAAQLNDPHVIPIHDFGEIDGRLYIDMRLVDGRDLSDVIAASGPLPVPEAVGIVAQVAGALDAAHAEGLVHRDVKPANILLTGLDRPGRTPFAYLVDFGIARAVEDGAGTSQLTTTGTIGTIAYMAPERIMGGTGDGRADVYALGCVLYEALTGRRPFEGEPAAVLYAQVHNPPPDLAAVAPQLPAGLRAAIDRALAKRPDDRFATAGDFADAATAAIGGAARAAETTGPTAPAAVTAPTAPASDTPTIAGQPTLPGPGSPPEPAPESARRRRGLLIAAAGIVVLGAGIAVALGLSSGDSGAPQAGTRPPASNTPQHTRASTGGPSSSSPASTAAPPGPFRSAQLYAMAKPYFRPVDCDADPPASDAPLANQLPDRELVRCTGGGYSAVFFCKNSTAQLQQERVLYLGEAVAGTRRSESGGAGTARATFAESFTHQPYGGQTPPRVYWETGPDRCAAELQPLNNQSRATLVAHWRDGTA